MRDICAAISLRIAKSDIWKSKEKYIKKIVDWKWSSNDSKALLIEGARRIWKSTVVEEIGKNEYKSYILIDFNKASKKNKRSF